MKKKTTIKKMHNSSPNQTTSEEFESEDTISVSFLLEEFSRLHDLYLRQRVKRGERVNFFVGLSTAVGTGIVIASQTGIINPYTFQWLGFILLTMLGIFGVTIHSNLVMNDINSDYYLRGISKITRYFVERNNNLANYLLFPGIEKKPTMLLNFRLGSVRSIILVLTAMLFGGAAFIALSFIIQPIPLWLGIATVIAVGIIAIFFLQSWTVRQLKKAAAKY